VKGWKGRSRATLVAGAWSWFEVVINDWESDVLSRIFGA
jgi:hypothetical protein